MARTVCSPRPVERYTARTSSHQINGNHCTLTSCRCEISVRRQGIITDAAPAAKPPTVEPVQPRTARKLVTASPTTENMSAS